MKKKILIIGGTGFLGYHFAKKCLQNNFRVTSVSKKKPKVIRKILNIKYILCDITKKKMIQKKIVSNYDYIINFGGYVNHFEKKKTYRSHFIGCKNLVDFFKKKKLKKFIQIGSSVEYENNNVPHKEKFKINLKKITSTYGRAKYMATKYVQKHSKSPYIVVRPYLVYGPRQDFNRLIPVIIKNCLENKKFPCSVGNQLRDFLYVTDFADVIFKCLVSNNIKNQILNVGFGKLYRVKHVINKINSKIGYGIPDYGKIKLRKGEKINFYPSINKIKSLTKWVPKINLNKGLDLTIKFYENYLR